MTTFETAWSTPAEIVRQYFRNLFEIILHPVRFYRQMPQEGGTSIPLVFALVTHWIGTAIAFLWKIHLGETSFNSYFTLFISSDRVLNWILGAGPVVIDPFLTLVSIFITSIFIFFGARILISSSPVRFESILRIVCFGMSPTILTALPLAGNLLAPLASTLITIIGVREVYRISTLRAVMIALFPKLLFLGIIISGLFFFGWALLKSLFSLMVI